MVVVVCTVDSGKGWNTRKLFHTKHARRLAGAHWPYSQVCRYVALCPLQGCLRLPGNGLPVWTEEVLPPEAQGQQSRTPTWYMFSLPVRNLGRSLVWQKGRWPGCQKTRAPNRARTLTGWVNIKKGLHFWELQFPCLIWGQHRLYIQALKDASKELKHSTYPKHSLVVTYCRVTSDKPVIAWASVSYAVKCDVLLALLCCYDD